MPEASIAPDLDGARLDVALAKVATISRGAARRAIDAGGVFLDDRRERTQAQPVAVGQLLRWTLAAPAATAPPLQTFDVVYEDERLLIVCKPAGLDTVPAARGGPSLLSLVQEHLRGQQRRPLAESHRLDRETSGLLAFGRDPPTVAWLGRALARRQIGRGYLALVRCARPPTAMRIEAPLRPAAHGGVEVHPTGAPAATRLAPLAFDPAARVALVALALESGRTHQARVHLAWAVGPIVGDARYGDPQAAVAHAAAGVARIGLHCGRLGLRDPATGAPRTWLRTPDPSFEALAGAALALPATWGEVLRDLGRGDFVAAGDVRQATDAGEARDGPVPALD